MRVVPIALMLPLVALAGCKREPDFAERYRNASARITESARDIDAQIAGTEAPVEDSGQP